MSKIILTLLAVLAVFGTTEGQIIRDYDYSGIEYVQSPQIEQTKDDYHRPSTSESQRDQSAEETFRLLSNSATANEISGQEPGTNLNAALKVNNYNLANYVFNAQYYLGDLCNRCKKFEYFAFRIGDRYLTAYPSDLRFVTSSSPSNQQLFIGYQQVDGTWAFQSIYNYRYIRASNDGSTINYQSYVGPWERWYMERHGNHVHIQSAQFQHHYWISSGNVLKQLYGGASSLIVEHWPKINWLWNW